MSLMDWLGWIAFIINIAAVLLNMYKNKWGYWVWNVADFTFMIYNISIKNWSQAGGNLVCIIFQAIAYFKWSNDEKKEKCQKV
jgi:nicotinamide riboside transporter PnuC